MEDSGQKGVDATLALETQTRELLDVDLKQGSNHDAGLRACMTQIAWSVELPSDFANFETWIVSL